MKEQLTIIRKYDAPRELVFEAFSTAEAMSAWWGPVESETTVISFDFRPKGIFHYKMESPNGTMYGRFVYGNIQSPESIEFINSFTDEKGNIVQDPFGINWPLEVYNKITLTEENGKTTLMLKGYPINPTDEQYKSFIDMQENVQAGFNATFNQLENYLSAAFKIRKDLKTTKMARVSTYLNFAGNTEEVMNFYKAVFRTEFNGGIQKFGDLPPAEGQPELTEEQKKMVLHVELPILGGHILMATDAPESMGFHLKRGNNMHIMLDTDTREEAQRIFDELSIDGEIEMPMQDMFWGTFFGSFTDKFGINWMVNHAPM